MTQPNRRSLAHAGAERPAPDLPTAFLDPFLAAQRLQWDALISWQRSLAAFQKDLWDQWVCRYAGGAPFDA